MLVLIIIGSAYLLTAYTPFPTWVEGRSDYRAVESKEFRRRLAQLNQRIDAQSQYITTLQRKLSGEDLTSISYDSILQTLNDTLMNDVTPRVARIPLDDTLRYRVQRSNLNVPVKSPLILNETYERNLEDEYLIPPIRGTVSKSFSLIENHFGVDILAPENSAVQCILDGLVIESDWTLEGGNTIMIQHAHNLISVYKHNSALLKKKGDLVKTGEALAVIGNTGLHSDGPHVHFELWYNGEPIDPEAYISLARG